MKKEILEGIKAFEEFIENEDYNKNNINNDIINEFCTMIFYNCESEEDMEVLNEVEDELRKKYLKEEKEND